MANQSDPRDEGTPTDQQWSQKRQALRWFEYEHLRHPELKEISRQFHEFATSMYDQLQNGAERSAGMRKLLEAKDCMVRQALVDRPELD